jgi:hypothetical protein
VTVRHTPEEMGLKKLSGDSGLRDLSSVVRRLSEDGFDVRLRTADAEASAHLPSSH